MQVRFLSRDGVVKRQTNPTFCSTLSSFYALILSISASLVLCLFSFTTALDASPIQAKIVRPHTGDQLNGKVDLFGVAHGTMFKEYRLEYAAVPTAQGTNALTGWRQIGGRATAPVPETGFLGQWDAQRLRGEYLIRLVVVSTQGDEIQDQIHIFIENEHPRLEVSDPREGLLTLKTQITVQGVTEKSNAVILKSGQIETPLSLDIEGRFVAQLPLSEGPNLIQIHATNPIGLETSITRTVVRDSQAPEITLTTPPDAAVREVPYVTVSGQIDDLDADLSINDTAVPLNVDGSFERTLSLKEGGAVGVAGEEVPNLVRVVAIDRLGRKTTVQRRIRYRKRDRLLGIDLNPPAITEVLPPDGTSLDRSDVKITGVLIDDVDIDPQTIRFTFDEETFTFDGSSDAAKLDGRIFDFQPRTGRFTYTPPTELGDGVYRFKLEVQDTAGNSATPIDFTFVIDTRPFQASISAERIEGENRTLRITLTATKRLATAPILEVLPSSATLGYTPTLDRFSVTDDQQPIFQYTVDFPISSSQTGFTFSTQVRSLNGEALSVRGYFTDQNRLPEDIQFPQFIRGDASPVETILLSIDSGPSVLLREGEAVPQVTLRSQGGLDRDAIHAQQQNAEERELTILYPVYVVESPVETQGVSFQLALPLPLGREREEKGIAMFQWDSLFQQWLPLDAIRNRFGMFEATVDRFGSYALLMDWVPPIISAVFPEDSTEVQPERFLILYEITDAGSGVDAIQLWVDHRSVEFFYEDKTGELTYLPSNLEAGRHTLEITATDRAGNEAHRTVEFFTQDIFDFADRVIVYPNPTSHSATITFRLTKSADVMLEIYDVTGDLLYTDILHNVVGQQSASLDEAFVWEGKNQGGEPVAGGIYIYVLEAERDGEIVRRLGKVAVLR